MLSAVWNLRKKLPNSTRKTLRSIANTTGVASFLPPADEERLQRELRQEAEREGLEEEVAEVEQLANAIYQSQEAMRNLGQNENTIKELTQKDFIQWKTEMEKKGKFWETALKLFLKYRGRILSSAGLKEAYTATVYNPHEHFNPSFIKPQKALKYANQIERNYKSTIFRPEYTELPQFINSSLYLPQPPVFIQPQPMWTPSLPQLGRGRSRKYKKKTRKTRKSRR